MDINNENQFENKDENENKIDYQPTFYNVMILGSYAFKIGIGLLLTIFSIFVLFSTNDTFTKIVIIPFIIAGIGKTLTGLIPLIFNNSKLENIGVKIFLFGFSLFFFGFLIIFDYIAIQQNQINSLIFSLAFWLIGTYIIISLLKKCK